MNDESAAAGFVGFFDEQDFDPDQPEEARPFELTDLAVLPAGLAPAALDAIARWGARNGVALDAPSFVPTRAAVRTWNGYSMGEPVIGLLTWRGVGEVRMNGVPGLLVAEVTVTDDAPIDATLADARVDLYFVAFATAFDAERVAIVRTPGFPFPLIGAVEGTR
ncbi:hypothetical protein [Anaeromyxobacter sp. Fw109-5]|uniref:hypothetical protein n=1 Tax=Anaeromyxobacter sp. (strain Fw109-5) TaxID=404589 RepID=UPI0000ED6DA1|nr:hypothetical protein [Anaeromyxobacter sp. Fw109-5]ABS28201.1 hypothetical protein Anae109_4023 [Anaeromyxobacter sp. Fw109-5]